MDPRDRDIDKHLRKTPQDDGSPEPPSGDARGRLERRRRAPWRRAGFAGLALAVIAALAVVVLPRVDLNRSDTGRPAGPPDTVTPAPSQDPAGVFPAFYPVTTFQDAKRLQDSVDNGHQPLTLEPREVARQFARDYIGWQKVEITSATKSGSAAEGWTATVELRPYIGEAEPRATLGRRHVVELIGLKGTEAPTWFVTAITSDSIVLDAGSRPMSAGASPVAIKGKGVGFEGTILVQIKDDTGTVLHPRPGKKEGYVQGGAYEPAPFEGTLAYDRPKTRGGVLILTNDSGSSGPSPDWTIVRVSFAPA